MKGKTRKRPLGVAIIAWLQMSVGIIGILCMLLIMLPELVGMRAQPTAISSLRVTIAACLCAACFLIFSILGVSGMGLWLGKKWGWYLATLYYAFFIISTPWRFIVGGNEPAGHSAWDYAGLAVEMTLAILVYMYFCRKSVRAHFRLRDIRMRDVVATQFAVALLYILALSVTSTLGLLRN